MKSLDASEKVQLTLVVCIMAMEEWNVIALKGVLNVVPAFVTFCKS